MRFWSRSNMEYKKFKNGLDMYNYIASGNDLYSKSLSTYVFVYNDAGALCVYALDPEDVTKLIVDSKEYDEYWGAFLGWRGSSVLDEGCYDDQEHRYSDDWEMRKLYLEPSLEFCENNYYADDWLLTSDVTADYVLN